MTTWVLRRPSGEGNFTAVGNHIIDDERLGPFAVGVMAWMLRQPDGAPLSARAIANSYDEVGVKAVQTAVRKLRDCGYVHHRKVRKGRNWETEVCVTYRPCTGEQAWAAVDGMPLEETPSEYPESVSPRSTENRDSFLLAQEEKNKTSDVLTSEDTRWLEARAVAELILDYWALTFGRGRRRKLTAAAVMDADRLLRLGECGLAKAQPVPFDDAIAMVEAIFEHLAAPNAGGFCWAKQIQSAGNLREHWQVLVDAVEQARRPRLLRPAPWEEQRQRSVKLEESRHPAARLVTSERAPELTEEQRARIKAMHGRAAV